MEVGRLLHEGLLLGVTKERGVGVLFYEGEHDGMMM